MSSTRRTQNPTDLAARITALTPQRLAILTGAFIIALSALLVIELNDKAASRKTETALRLNQAASDGAAAMNIAIMTGASSRHVLTTAWPGGQSAVFHLSTNGDVIAKAGAAESDVLDGAVLSGLDLSARGHQEIRTHSGRFALSWRPLDNGEALLAAAPARDLYGRSYAWVVFAIILAATSLVVISLMAAFLRQSRAAAEAAGALTTLHDFKTALTGGRGSPWFYDGKSRKVMFTKALLEPLGLGGRDRWFSLREITALVHPEDLRTIIGVVTGEPSGVTEGVVRWREPGGAWSRSFMRTSRDATRFERAGMAFDISGAPAASPNALIAETRLRDAIESIPEAFVLWDANDRLAIWNKRFAGVFRIPQKMLKPGLTIHELATAAGVAGDVLTAEFGPLTDDVSKNVEVALPNARWAHVSRRRTAEGGCVCIATNVSDMKRRARAQKIKERELKRTVDDLELSRRELSDTMRKYQYEKYRAEEASRSKSEFLANMSHELRTPLNAINGFSEVMQSELYGPLGDQKYKEYVNDILSSGKHLLELIDDVLDMSLIESGRLKLDPKKIELERTLNESIRLVEKRAADAGVALTSSIKHAPPIWADARAVKQVATNLLSNAIKFTPNGGEVTLTAQADLDGVTIIVADSGCGIERSQLKRLGQPFESTGDEAATPSSGSGLGLALSKSLMEMQGGLLAIASEPGKGTVACATFPRRTGAARRLNLPAFIGKDAHLLTGDQNARVQFNAEAAE